MRQLVQILIFWLSVFVYLTSSARSGDIPVYLPNEDATIYTAVRCIDERLTVVSYRKQQDTIGLLISTNPVVDSNHGMREVSCKEE